MTTDMNRTEQRPNISVALELQQTTDSFIEKKTDERSQKLPSHVFPFDLTNLFQFENFLLSILKPVTFN